MTERIDVPRHRSPIILRSFVDCQFGQMHARSVVPAVSIRTPLICVHHVPHSGRIFTATLADLGTDRAAHAMDLPGFGDSDGPASPPRIQDYAEAVGKMIDGLGYRQVDVLGYHTGSAVAVELALSRPSQARRLVLVGIPLFGADEEPGFVQSRLIDDPDYVATEWDRSRRWALNWGGTDGVPLPVIFRGFVDKLKAGETAHWGTRATAAYPLAERLACVKQPVLAISPKDDLWEISPRAEALMRNGSFERWPDVGLGIFDVAAARINDRLRRHLDP